MRDPQRQNRYGNKFNVYYPDFPSFNQRPKSFTLYQNAGKHDVLEIYYHAISANFIKSLTTGVAVEIKWSNDVTSETFIGYVSDLRYPATQAIERFIKVTCIAASYPLKDQPPKIWRNVTASEVATEIAQSIGLNPVVTKSDIRFGQLSLASHSKWEKLQELATRIGYACQVYKTDLHFHPIDTMINQFLTTMPVMAFLNPAIEPQSMLASQTLDFFETTQGDYVERSETTRSLKTIGGVDPYTAKVYSTTSSPNAVGKKLRKNTKDPLFSVVDAGTVITDSVMSQSLSDAKAQLARLSIPARGIGQGDPRIFPWSTIEVRGTGEASDGFWVVKSATHKLSLDGKYTCEFTCATDGIGTNQPSAVRPSTAGMVPVVDLSKAITTGVSKKTSYKLTNTSPMINQTKTGYNVVPRRWVTA